MKLYFDRLPDTKYKCNIFKKHVFSLNHILNQNDIYIAEEDIVEIDSKKHVILQCLDIILGAINFKLNGLDKVKIEGTNRRGKTTIAKEKLYKVILSNIREIYPNFNIGISTSDHGNEKNRWLDSYRHWNFKANNSEFNPLLTKKR